MLALHLTYLFVWLSWFVCLYLSHSICLSVYLNLSPFFVQFHIYIYFKNTDYLLVKTALLFSLENFQNCVVSRGRLGSQPPLSHRVTPETSPWRSARVSHCKVLAYTVDTVFLRSYFLHRYFLFIAIFSILTFTQMLLTLSQTFCTSAVLLHVCKVRLRYERWIKQQSGRQQIWPLTNQNKGNFGGSVLTAHHVGLCFYMIIIPYAISAEIRYVI